MDLDDDVFDFEEPVIFEEMEDGMIVEQNRGRVMNFANLERAFRHIVAPEDDLDDLPLLMFNDGREHIRIHIAFVNVMRDIGRLPNDMRRRMMREMTHLAEHQAEEYFQRVIAEEVQWNENELVRLQLQVQNRALLRYLVDRGRIVDDNAPVGPNDLILDLDFGPEGNEMEVEEEERDNWEDINSEEELEDAENAFGEIIEFHEEPQLPRQPLLRDRHNPMQIMLDNLWDDVAQRVRPPRREPESENLILPRTALRNWKLWKDTHVIKWVNKFVTEASHLRIIRYKKWNGNSLFKFVESETQWKEDHVPFALYVNLKVHLNRVVNEFDDRMSGRRF